MGIDISVLIGGEAGQGIQTVGELLARVCRKAGLYIMAINDFESRIRGGHSFFQIRISDRPVNAPHRRINLLLSLDKKSYELHRKDLLDDGIALMEKNNSVSAKKLLTIPFLDLAEKSGGKITSNTVAAGACLGLLGAPVKILREVVSGIFAEKGEAVIGKNLDAALAGYEAVKTFSFKYAFKWRAGKPKGVLADGSRAIALGALAGDCRFAAFYPMSPATGIMAHLASVANQFPLVVEQAEDEISAVNMAIGASFAGARSMTATSGGGFCLMTEGLGLSGITETPIVIVNAQRPGPATGMATRTAQADLLFIINASQGEFPRFVFAPGTPAEAFETTRKAFHLSDKYQVPSIILADQYLNDSLFIAEKNLKAPGKVKSFVVGDTDMKNPSGYKRYALTRSGVSPRALPCAGKAIVMVSGNEHKEDGHTTESIATRIKMVNKRNAKLSGMLSEMNPPETYFPGSKILLAGWGSTKGAIREAVDILRKEKISAGCVNFNDLWPFPAAAAKKTFLACEKFYMVEQNSTAQLGRLIKEQTALSYSGAVLKYDGRPFYPVDIADGIKKYVR
ncbi:MAG: 2-oxoglutarate/2-oxoacid ferredoxin oxidoreductase subunit alpha [Thermodesulfobacteriota bacterium]|nr:2-oxoglutarate/2-oxoacid ferredoxin oxidoreductase subunit alpha [Thermodesulfobacteriota bacterium]